jgi:hypothetical protein
MPGTWSYWSQQVFGYVEKMSPVNEEYVALRKIQHHIDQGYSDKEIALIWNQGNASPCKAGTNSKGVKYDSCNYVQKFTLAMR